MSRTTNRDQFSAIISEMKLNPDIAKNNTKRPPEDLRQFWHNLKDKLNLLGPPMKDVAEWKKVWSDYKSHLKKKLTHNKKEQRATGGGPNKMHTFTEEEEDVIALVALKDVVDGISNVTAFGCPSSSSNTGAIKETLKRRSTAYDLLELNTNAHNDENHDNDIDVQDLENVPKKPKKQMTSFELSIAQYELMKSQVEIQKNLSNAIQKSLKSSEENSKNMQYNTRRIYKVLEEIKVQNAEHNTKMQGIALSKLQLKEELLELELKHKQQTQ